MKSHGSIWIISGITVSVFAISLLFQNCSPMKNTNLKGSLSSVGGSSISSPTGVPSYSWSIKLCTTDGCTPADVGVGSFDYIPRPREECNASSVRRVVTIRIRINTTVQDLIAGCRSSSMSTQEFLNMMTQNSMATYDFSQAINNSGSVAQTGSGAGTPTGGGSTTGGGTVMPAAGGSTTGSTTGGGTSSGAGTPTSGSGGFAGVQGGGSSTPAPVTYNWYVPFLNAPMVFTSYPIPIGCSAASVGTVVSIRDAAIADRRVMCLASNGISAISAIMSTNPSYTYQGNPNGSLSPLSDGGAGTGAACTISGNLAPVRSQKQFQSVWCSAREAPHYQTGVIGSYPDGPSGYGNNPEDWWYVTCQYIRPGHLNSNGVCIAD